jgi:hypothetical protein
MIDVPEHTLAEDRLSRPDPSPFLGIGVLGIIGVGLLLVSPARRLLTSPRGVDTLMVALRRIDVPVPIIAALANLLGVDEDGMRRATTDTRPYTPASRVPF